MEKQTEHCFFTKQQRTKQHFDAKYSTYIQNIKQVLLRHKYRYGYCNKIQKRTSAKHRPVFCKTLHHP